MFDFESLDHSDPGAVPQSFYQQGTDGTSARAKPEMSSGVLADEVETDTGPLWALAGDLLWDGVAESAVSGFCVVIRGGKINGVLPMAEAERRGIWVEQHPGCCLLPGLIDAHVHLEFNENHPLHAQPQLGDDALSGQMADRALRMVRHGITACRDLGGGARFAALELKAEIEAGRLPGPRIVCAGQPITTPNGHCHQWGGAVRTEQDIDQVVRRQVERGADWIKVMATGGMKTPGTKPEQAQFSTQALRAVVAAAAEHGRPVAAHAHGVPGVISAVEAGCRTVEHCSWIGPGWEWGCADPVVVRQMAERGVFISPTAHAKWKRRPMGDTNFRRQSAALAQMHRAGVRIVTSSDAGAISGLSHDALAGAVEVLAGMAQLSNCEALRAATSLCAEAVGLSDVCGRLAPGLGADLLLVAGDPTRDLSALHRPQLVVARGQRIEPHGKDPPPPLGFAAALGFLRGGSQRSRQ